jgi:hypothetical protein
MSGCDGSASEMPVHQPINDGAIAAALAGTTRDADESLMSFVSGVRNAVEAVPTPSTAMAAVLAAGFSTEKGDLSATAASNVNGPASQESGPSKWRQAKMKIKGFLAGLGIAGKIGLGIGVAAAATTGAGATGLLPFSIRGASHDHSQHVVAVGTTSTTPRSAPTNHPGTPVVQPRPKRHTNHQDVVVTPTTGLGATPKTTVEVSPVTPTTATTATTPTEPTTVFVPISTPTTDTTPTTETTPTTQPPSGHSILLSCAVTGATQVTCSWTASATAVAHYALWRWTTGGNGSDYAAIYTTAGGLSFVDNNASPGTPYTYRVFTTLGNGSPGPVSARAYLTCCN